MTQEIDLNDLGLLELQFTPTDKHQKLISEIHTLKASIDEKDQSIDPQVVPERVREAFLHMSKTAKEKQVLTENDICSIHKTLKMSGKYRKPAFDRIGIERGALHPYFPPGTEHIPGLLKKYLERYAHQGAEGEPLQMACEDYLLFELIHPFDDGNGRTGRLICASRMIQHDYGVLAQTLEQQWGNENQSHFRAFNSDILYYEAWLGHPDLFNNFFSTFYLYFLEEMVAILTSLIKNTSCK